MANFNFNKVILGGRLTATPELKQTQQGVMVTKFTVAVNRKYSSKDEKDANASPQSDFIRVTAWRQQAEFVSKYFQKGSSICIVGSLYTNSWTDQQGNKQFSMEVTAEEIQFVDSKNEGQAQANPYAGAVPQFEQIEDDDCPF